MRNTRLLIVLLPFLLVSCGQEREELPTRGRMSGLVCESQASVMRIEAEEFERLYPDAHVTLAVTTTRDAIVQLLNDSVSFICVDRALNREERAVAEKAGLEFTEINMAEDALGVIVHPGNPLESITLSSLEKVFSGAVTNWSELSNGTYGGSILPAMTGRNSGTYELLTRRFLKLNRDAALAQIADSQKSVLDYVITHRGALGIVSVASLRDTTSSVKVLPVTYTDSTGASVTAKLHQANIYQRVYPLHYPVYVYVRAGSRGVASGLSTFMASGPGQKIFLNAGLVPATMPVRLVSLHQEEQE